LDTRYEKEDPGGISNQFDVRLGLQEERRATTSQYRVPNMHHTKKCVGRLGLEKVRAIKWDLNAGPE